MTKWEEIYNKYPTKLHPTEQEADTLPVALHHWFVANDQGERVRFAKFHDRCIWNVNPDGPWVDFHSNEPVSREAIRELLPHIDEVDDFNIYTGEATYNNKDIRWSPDAQLWKYRNYRTVHFNETPTEGTNSALNSDKEEDSEPDEDTAQVEDLLRRAETTVTSAIQKLSSRPETPSPANSPLPKASPLPGKSQLSTTEIRQVPTSAKVPKVGKGLG